MINIMEIVICGLRDVAVLSTMTPRLPNGAIVNCNETLCFAD